MNSYSLDICVYPSMHCSVNIPGRADSPSHEDHLDGSYPRDTELPLRVFCCNFPKEEEGIKNIKSDDCRQLITKITIF